MQPLETKVQTTIALEFERILLLWIDGNSRSVIKCIVSAFLDKLLDSVIRGKLASTTTTTNE